MRIRLLLLVCVVLIAGLFLSTYHVSADESNPVNVHVEKVKMYVEKLDPENRTWIYVTRGINARPCGYRGEENWKHVVEDISTYEHKITITVTYVTGPSLDLCVQYGHWGYISPIGKYPKGTHRFMVNEIGATIVLKKDQ